MKNSWILPQHHVYLCVTMLPIMTIVD
ncbi:rCG44804 [Rattus norvegicus]|uniref:RCG44804 n=1 Tax=Rattus norvegicus TaxID=10116 RepID=A6I4J4_RAT|nr:rCG44804 [Rattus norvegicus]